MTIDDLIHFSAKQNVDENEELKGKYSNVSADI